MQSDPSIDSEIRNHVWAYFALHAQQRMSAFQFFITLETALFGALFLIVQFAKESAAIFSVLGLLIALFSFVFWKIDQRTRDLIKNSEISLLVVENYLKTYASFSIGSLPFELDNQVSGGMKALPLIPGRLSYSKCFGTVFLVSGLAGVGAFFWLLTIK